MAVKKKGLDYFPFDTSFFENDKIQFVGALFGMKGENVVIRLLCRIYSPGYRCFLPNVLVASVITQWW